MFKWLYNLIWPEIIFPEYTYKLSEPGYPPTYLTWEQAFPMWERQCIPMRIGHAPVYCSECGTDVVETAYDWVEIEGKQYPQVYSYACPNGHGYCVEVM